MKSSLVTFSVRDMDNNIISKINKAALRFLEPLTPELTYHTILEEAMALVGGDEGFILLNESGELKHVYGLPNHLKPLKVRKNGFSYESFSQKKAFIVYAKDYYKVHPEIIDRGIQTAMLIPLSYRHKSIGTMAIMSQNKKQKFSEKDLEILKLFGSTASMAIRKTQLYAETKSALDSRDFFLSMAAHEFRTPITTISGYAQMLKLKLSKLHQTERRWVDEIHREVNRLSRLVNELLEVNRIRSGQAAYRWEECDLKKLLQKSLDSLIFAYPERDINFTDQVTAKCAFIVGDPDKLLQVFNNLLSNAAKFSAPTQTIKITLTDSKDDYEIQVQDQGIGIDKKDLKKIFEGFYRSHNNPKEGMGLGLYIVKEIVNQHKGEVRIKSKPNKGTLVQVALPKI